MSLRNLHQDIAVRTQCNKDGAYMSCKVIQHKFNIHYLSIGEGLGKKSYYIKVSGIPSPSKSINALFHQ